MKVDPNNKTICSYLWSSLCIRTSERVLPCCIFDDQEPAVQLHHYKNNVQDAYNSLYFQTMRARALQGQENKGCSRCYFREKETGHSLRRRANNEWREEFNGTITSSLENITYLELFMGNLCNLKCLMCAPQLSSSLARDYVDLGLAEDSTKNVIENDYTDLLTKLPNLRRLKFVGGEPLLIKGHWKLLASIKPERAQNITLEYATNCTVFPDDEMLDLWRRFAGVEAFISIDGYGATNDYIRFPSRWNIVEKNAKKFKQFLDERPDNIFGINSAITIYNVFDLDKLSEWAYGHFGDLKDRHGNNAFFLSCSVSPEYLSIQHMPQDIKEELLSKYPDNRHYAFVRATLKTEGDPSQMPIFREKTLAFDRVRKISYLNYVPSVQRLMERDSGLTL